MHQLDKLELHEKMVKAGGDPNEYMNCMTGCMLGAGATFVGKCGTVNALTDLGINRWLARFAVPGGCLSFAHQLAICQKQCGSNTIGN